MAESLQSAESDTVLQWAREICEAKGLDPERDADDVVGMSDQDPDEWEACCEGGCSPCVAVVQSAALALRRRVAAAKAAAGDS